MPLPSLLPSRVAALAARWWIHPAAILAGSVAAVVVASLIPSTYRAEATLVVVGPAPTREAQLTFAGLAASPAVMERAAATLAVSTETVEAAVRVVPAPQSLLIRVFATDSDEEMAVAMANATANALPAYLQASGLDDARSLRVARLAAGARRESAPLLVIALLGGLAGGVLSWSAARLQPLA